MSIVFNSSKTKPEKDDSMMPFKDCLKITLII